MTPGTRYDGQIIGMLNAAVRVKGSYEAAADEQPRLVRIEQITVTRPPDQQLELGVDLGEAPSEPKLPEGRHKEAQ